MSRLLLDIDSERLSFFTPAGEVATIIYAQTVRLKYREFIFG